MKLTQEVRVKNASGLHTRPAAFIVKLLQNCRSKVFFTCRDERINAKSIMGILMLAAHKNSKVRIDVEGEDAQGTMDLLLKAFENQFAEGMDYG